MNICFFNSSKTWGGGEKWHLEAATALDPALFQVVAGVHPDSELRKRLARAGIETRAFAIGNLSLLNPVRLWQLFRWFKSQCIDTVILNLPSDLKAAGVAAKLAGVPRIIYRRGSAIPVRNNLLNRWLFSAVITDVLANSEETKRTVLAHNPTLIEPDRIRVIYNGIDLPPVDIPAIDQAAGGQGKPVVLGTVGRLSYQKNQVFLLDVAKVLKQRGLDFRLSIAGEGPLEQELRAQARALGVADLVDFPGFVDDIPGFMRKIDIFLLCSHWEGFGYVMTEAMASSKPVIAFGNSSVPEIVVDQETGLLTEPGRLDLFADAVAALAVNPALRARMGLAGRRRVERIFSKRRLLEELTEFLLAGATLPGASWDARSTEE